MLFGTYATLKTRVFTISDKKLFSIIITVRGTEDKIFLFNFSFWKHENTYFYANYNTSLLINTYNITFFYFMHLLASNRNEGCIKRACDSLQLLCACLKPILIVLHKQTVEQITIIINTCFMFSLMLIICT